LLWWRQERCSPRPVTARGRRAPGEIKYEEHTLDNGLRVVLSEDHSVPVVAVNVWYHVGSALEEKGRSGFAHLFEHMMFEGSANVDKGEHFKYVSEAGGNNNGSTTEDRTNYYETLPSNRLNLGLWLEADRMKSLVITKEKFENQRETVKEERRQGIDNQPYGEAFLVSDTLGYDGWPYDHTVIAAWTTSMRPTSMTCRSSSTATTARPTPCSWWSVTSSRKKP
jgi:predicted Zn-dependent peptidase